MNVPKNDLLDIAADFATERLKLAGGGVLTLPIPLQTVLLLNGAQYRIDNGGFQYFFESDFDGNPPYSAFSDAYRRIGAFTAADCLDRAVAVFPFDQPHLSQDKRNEFLGSMEETNDFFGLDDRMLAEDKKIWQLLTQYVADHAGSFKPS
jgi:Domain of unknown function (DUF4375)